MGDLRVSELNFFPVKSMGGIPLRDAALDARGIVRDRHWMVISQARGRFLTQRGQPRLALVEPSVGDDGKLTLTAPEHDPLVVDPAAHGEVLVTEIWRDRDVRAIDQGDAAAAWLTGFLGKPSRLVRIADDHVRAVDAGYANGAQVGLADAFPLLVIGEGSFRDLNDRLLERGHGAVPMNRFRPNIVVAGAAPYEEDEWAVIRIGDVVLDLPKPCGRCEITNTDQATAAREDTVLSTLRTYRDYPGFDDPVFGWNGVHRGMGRLAVGMTVTVEERR